MSPRYSPLEDCVKAIMPIIDDHQLCLYPHGSGWDILTRHPGPGMKFRAYQKIWRLLGVHQFQVNGIRAQYREPDDSFVRSFEDVSTPIFSEKDCALPVVGSGQWGGQAWDTYARTGRVLDLMYLAGGGIHGHPMGLASGAKTIQQAWRAAEIGVKASTYAKNHPELAAAFAKWQDQSTRI